MEKSRVAHAAGRLHVDACDLVSHQLLSHAPRKESYASFVVA